MKGPSQPRKKTGKATGKRKARIARYYANQTHRRNSIKRIFNSQGPWAAQEYAKKYSIETWAKKRLESLARRKR